MVIGIGDGDTAENTARLFLPVSQWKENLLENEPCLEIGSENNFPDTSLLQDLCIFPSWSTPSDVSDNDRRQRLTLPFSSGNRLSDEDRCLKSLESFCSVTNTTADGEEEEAEDDDDDDALECLYKSLRPSSSSMTSPRSMSMSIHWSPKPGE